MLIANQSSKRFARRWIACFVLAFCIVPAHGAETTHWVGSWACAPVRQPLSDKTSYSDVTIRNVVHLSLGGNSIRIKLSNAYGASTLLVGETHVAISQGSDKTASGTDHKVTFGGKDSIAIPAGAFAVSDPIEMPMPALSDLAISIYIPKQTLPVLSYHPLASTSTYLADANQTSGPELHHPQQIKSWMLLTGVDVRAPLASSAIVTLGDSITDGAHSTFDKNRRWPDFLAARLHANPSTSQIGVLNEGISGNRILHDAAGTNALARLDRDVLSQSGAKYLIVLESINDIRYATNPRNPDDVVTGQQLIWALQQIAIRAHARGLKVYCGTLTPFAGSKNANSEGEEMRRAINAWIRTSGAFDAVLDFDRTTQDPANPASFSQFSDSGDHLHPGDAGYKAMADSINLALF